MQRTTRLVHTINMLSQPKVTRAGDIARHFGISERTVYRDIKALIRAGLPIQGEAGVGYRLKQVVKPSTESETTPAKNDITGDFLRNTLPYIGTSASNDLMVGNMQIPIAKPWFDEDDSNAIQEPLTTGWVVQGPKVAEFESSVCDFTDALEGVACTSATTGLHLALAALGIGPGDEVIVPSFSFVASANAVAYTQARPVLVDIDLNTFNIDPAAIKAAITPNTRAIMPVHLFGQAAPMNEIMSIAHEHELAVIEDTACALGTRYGDNHVGTIGDMGVFSFHPRKVISTGEGGMLITMSSTHASRLRTLRSHGFATKSVAEDDHRPSFLLGDFDTLGFNYRMTDIQGALGCTQMKKLPDILSRKRRLAKRYDEKLDGLECLKRPTESAGTLHSYQAYVCLFTPTRLCFERWQEIFELRNQLMNEMATQGVSTRQGTQAIHGLSLYQGKFGYSPEDLPNAWLAEHCSIALPLYPQMTDAEQDYVVDVLLKCAGELL